MDLPKRLRTFDLVASHHQIKNDSLCDLGVSAVKANYYILSSIISRKKLDTSSLNLLKNGKISVVSR
jgi:hypothetical protein